MKIRRGLVNHTDTATTNNGPERTTNPLALNPPLTTPDILPAARAERQESKVRERGASSREVLAISH